MRTNPLVHSYGSPTRLSQVQSLAIACSAHPPAFANVLPLLNSAIGEYVLRLCSSRLLKRRLHDSMMTGEMKVSEWLRRHPSAMHSQLGVSLTTFRLVLHDLEELGGLAPTRYISSWIQLAIFLYMCREGLGVRHAGECFQRGLETVAK